MCLIRTTPVTMGVEDEDAMLADKKMKLMDPDRIYGRYVTPPCRSDVIPSRLPWLAHTYSLAGST